MKTRILLSLIAILGSYSSAFALPGERGIYPRERAKPEIVKWIGEVKDDSSTHTTAHEHDLKFTKTGEDKAYDLESPEILKMHHESGKNFIVEIEAEKTPRFLFWGGKLLVKSFRVIEESSSFDHIKVTENMPKDLYFGPRK